MEREDGTHCQGKIQKQNYDDLFQTILYHFFLTYEITREIRAHLFTPLLQTYLKNGHDAPFVAVGPNSGVNTLSAVNEVRFIGNTPFIDIIPR